MQDRKNCNIQSRISFHFFHWNFLLELLEQVLPIELNVLALRRLWGKNNQVLYVAKCVNIHLLTECPLQVTLCYTMKTIISKSTYTFFQSL